MVSQVNRFFEKNRIDAAQVMYLTRDGRKTVLHMVNGRSFDTYLPLKEILTDLPGDMFECINKGVAVSSGYIVDIQNNVFFMRDGRQFKGRVRTTKSQKKMMGSFRNYSQNSEWNEFALMENLPLPFCVIEMVFGKKGYGVDFVFRYCNKKMLNLESIRENDPMDKSFYEVFNDADRKWMVAYADVALNGGQRVVEGALAEFGSDVKVFCYQPKQNYCLCIFVEK